MKDWKDELKKQAEGFYIGLGDLQSETGFMDGVNYAIDKSKPYIESLLKKERIRENDYWIGHTLNNENWTINKMDFEKRNLELEGGSKLNQMRNYEPSITLDQEEIV